MLVVIPRVVNDHRQEEGSIGRHQMTPIDGELPLEPEISLVTVVRVPGVDRHEQGAGLDLLADRPIPGVPATQFALVEPDLDACGTEGFTDAARRRRVLRGVA